MERNFRYVKKISEMKTTTSRIARLSFLLLMAYFFFGCLQRGGLSSSFAEQIMDGLQLAGYPARCAAAVFTMLTECLTRCAGGMFYWIG